MRIYLFLLFLFIALSCGKKKVNNTNNIPAPIVCSLQMSTIVVNDSVNFIIKDTSYITSNNTFYNQQQITTTKGCSFDFGGDQIPNDGIYTISSNFTEIIEGSQKVYVQYFVNGNSFQGQSGNVTVKTINNIKNIDFCKIHFQNSFNDTYVVSFKGILK